MSELAVGDRVTYSEYASYGTSKPDRRGTIVALGPKPHQVQVMWDDVLHPPPPAPNTHPRRSIVKVDA